MSRIQPLSYAEKTTARPATPNKQNSTGSGKRAQMKFYKQCTERGIFCMADPEDNDIGIDFLTHCPQSGARKTVQVTKGSRHSQSPNSYLISKGICDVREDIDIVAILIEHDQEESNVNTGQSGEQDMWFLVPFEVYRDERMWENYNLNTREKVWNLNVKKRLKPPMDKALDAWYTLSRKNIKASSFFE